MKTQKPFSSRTVVLIRRLAMCSFQTYLGEPVAEADFLRAEAKAERIINQITHGRAAHYAALPPVYQEVIRDGQNRLQEICAD